MTTPAQHPVAGAREIARLERVTHDGLVGTVPASRIDTLGIDGLIAEMNRDAGGRFGCHLVAYMGDGSQVTIRPRRSPRHEPATAEVRT